MKKIPIKNYVILIMLVLVSFLLTMYILTFYKNYKEERQDQAIISKVVSEVTEQEFDNFLAERDNFILYACSSKETKCHNFDKKLEEYITNNYLTEEVIYYNLKDSAKDTLLTFYNKYKSDYLAKKLNSYPAVFVFSNKKIVDVISSTNKGLITTSDFKKILESYEF